MGLLDLTDSTVPLPAQLVLDTSILLACRPGDNNPNAKFVKDFLERIGQRILAYQMVGWLLRPVLQECYHIILSQSLRRTWQEMLVDSRRSNWLATYKTQPDLLAAGFPDLDRFDNILSAIPLTSVQPEDLVSTFGVQSIEERIRYFITTYFLLPQDALILAEAERLGVPAVATLDRDWRRVTEFDIYTVLE